MHGRYKTFKWNCKRTCTVVCSNTCVWTKVVLRWNNVSIPLRFLYLQIRPLLVLLPIHSPNRKASTRINILIKAENTLIASFLSNTEGNYTAIVPAKEATLLKLERLAIMKKIGLDLTNQSSCGASVEPIKLVMLAKSDKVEPTPAKFQPMCAIKDWSFK